MHTKQKTQGRDIFGRTALSTVHTLKALQCTAVQCRHFWPCTALNLSAERFLSLTPLQCFDECLLMIVNIPSLVELCHLMYTYVHCLLVVSVLLSQSSYIHECSIWNHTFMQIKDFIHLRTDIHSQSTLIWLSVLSPLSTGMHPPTPRLFSTKPHYALKWTSSQWRSSSCAGGIRCCY